METPVPDTSFVRDDAFCPECRLSAPVPTTTPFVRDAAACPHLLPPVSFTRLKYFPYPCLAGKTPPSKRREERDKAGHPFQGGRGREGRNKIRYGQGGGEEKSAEIGSIGTPFARMRPLRHSLLLEDEKKTARKLSFIVNVFCCKLYFCRNVVAANFAAAKPPSQMPPCIGGAKRHCSRRHPRGQSNRMFASSSSIRRRIAPLPCSFSVYQKLTDTSALPCAMSNDV